MKKTTFKAACNFETGVRFVKFNGEDILILNKNKKHHAFCATCCRQLVKNDAALEAHYANNPACRIAQKGFIKKDKVYDHSCYENFDAFLDDATVALVPGAEFHEQNKKQKGMARHGSSQQRHASKLQPISGQQRSFVQADKVPEVEDPNCSLEALGRAEEPARLTALELAYDSPEQAVEELGQQLKEALKVDADKIAAVVAKEYAAFCKFIKSLPRKTISKEAEAAAVAEDEEVQEIEVPQTEQEEQRDSSVREVSGPAPKKDRRVELHLSYELGVKEADGHVTYLQLTPDQGFVMEPPPQDTYQGQNEEVRKALLDLQAQKIKNRQLGRQCGEAQWRIHALQHEVALWKQHCVFAEDGIGQAKLAHMEQHLQNFEDRLVLQAQYTVCDKFVKLGQVKGKVVDYGQENHQLKNANGLLVKQAQEASAKLLKQSGEIQDAANNQCRTLKKVKALGDFVQRTPERLFLAARKEILKQLKELKDLNANQFTLKARTHEKIGKDENTIHNLGVENEFLEQELSSVKEQLEVTNTALKSQGREDSVDLMAKLLEEKQSQTAKDPRVTQIQEQAAVADVEEVNPVPEATNGVLDIQQLRPSTSASELPRSEAELKSEQDGPKQEDVEARQRHQKNCQKLLQSIKKLSATDDERIQDHEEDHGAARPNVLQQLHQSAQKQKASPPPTLSNIRLNGQSGLVKRNFKFSGKTKQVGLSKRQKNEPAKNPYHDPFDSNPGAAADRH